MSDKLIWSLEDGCLERRQSREHLIKEGADMPGVSVIKIAPGSTILRSLYLSGSRDECRRHKTNASPGTGIWQHGLK